MTQLSGSRVLVTGATGGLGRAIAGALRREGCQLLLTGRREEALLGLAEELGAAAVTADLTDRRELSRLVADGGPIDIAVMNAAVPASGELEEWDQHQIDRAVELNLGGPIALTRLLLPGMRRRGRGHLVFVSSLSGKVASRGAPLYSATKFGLRGFAGGLRCDLVGTGIGCSAVFPGFVRDAGMFADAGVQLPFGVKTVTPEKVAAAVVRAVRTNRAEIDVAPLTLRIGAIVGSVAPGMSATLQRIVGSDLSAQLVRAQVSKRP